MTPMLNRWLHRFTCKSTKCHCNHNLILLHSTLIQCSKCQFQCLRHLRFYTEAVCCAYFNLSIFSTIKTIYGSKFFPGKTESSIIQWKAYCCVSFDYKAFFINSPPIYFLITNFPACFRRIYRMVWRKMKSLRHIAPREVLSSRTFLSLTPSFLWISTIFVGIPFKWLWLLARIRCQHFFKWKISFLILCDDITSIFRFLMMVMDWAID